MNHPFEHILLATEHTEFDVGAERVSFDMARRWGIPLYAVVPVISNPEYEVIAPQLAMHAEKAAADKIENLRKAATEGNIQLDVAARRGAEAYSEIIHEARKRKADLIVIRRRGKHSFLSSLMVGEMVSKVVRHAHCSVLFVPRTAQMWSRGVLAAVDSSSSAVRVVKAAASMALQSGLPLTLVSVATHEGPEFLEQAHRTLGRMLAIAADAGINAASVVPVGKAFEQILLAAKAADADLIVVGQHGESNLIHLPFGGTTQKVIGLAELPVLVVTPLANAER